MEDRIVAMSGKKDNRDKDKEQEKEKKIRRSKRAKHLLRSVLGVDVDLIQSVHLAEKVRTYTKEWGEYMKRDGGIIFLPSRIMEVGKEKAED